ncbi:hypothetical protein NW754_009422 [Fusarium falciforme]|nr:hypothetical protein NW754_009422 [Fusarium falciforme]
MMPQTLPQTYSHFRPIQGDGNCGWRALGFSYFEKLVDSGDQAKIEGEAARLLSMGHMLSTVGGYSYFEDWADELIGLLRQVAQSINDPTMAHMLVQEKWNDPSSANGMIYYLRLLAATYLKGNAATYEAFVNDGIGIPAYCAQFVEIPDHEIEHLGIIALVNTLLKPAGQVLEIAYLDRSPGTQVNRYRFPDEANGQDPATLGPIIYLLFRPNHYDILYRDPPVPVGPITMQVNRVSGFTHNTDITATQTDLGQFATLNFDSLAMIPGLNSGPAFGGLGSLAPPPQPVRWLSLSHRCSRARGCHRSLKHCQSRLRKPRRRPLLPSWRLLNLRRLPPPCLAVQLWAPVLQWSQHQD